MFDVHDIDLEGIWDVDDAGIPPRLDRPFGVWTDGEVRVTGTLVDHRPTAPAFAFRFDTPNGSVVFSGDTTVSPNLIDLAQDADVLVHEVIDEKWAKEMTDLMPDEQGKPLYAHLINSHTTVEQVGRDVAQVAGVKHLVLSHLVGETPDSTYEKAQQGFDGKLTIGHDLDVIAL